VTSDGSIYWSAGDALAKSTDHGVSWSRVGAGLVNLVRPIEVGGGRLVSAKSNSLVMSSDAGATWTAFGPPLPYQPAGVVYSDRAKALFIWHWDCGARVLPDAIERLSYDFGPAVSPPQPVESPPFPPALDTPSPPPTVDMPPPPPASDAAPAPEDNPMPPSMDEPPPPDPDAPTEGE
jgi:hypothetical protein